MSDELHKWPAPGNHLFDEWKPADRGKVYRKCVHPKCNHVEYKEARS